ncbi:MAG: cupredoxin domain-containing protein [Acidimicrobiales bacterium]
METKNPLRWVLAVLLVVGLGVALAACGDDDDDAATETTAPDDTTTTAPADDGDGGETATLAISGFAFPEDLTVPAGAAITIENADSAPHTVTADDGDFDVSIDGGTEGELAAPSEPGEYAYHCNIHSSMVATLIVE